MAVTQRQHLSESQLLGRGEATGGGVYFALIRQAGHLL